MKDKRRKILLGIDLEEFDIPEEYGQVLSGDQKLDVSYMGMLNLQDLLQKLSIPSTIFTTAYFASVFPEFVAGLAAQHEIGSHTFHHSSFRIEDLAASRKVLREISRQEVKGLRMPRMREVTVAAIREAGYTYDSSLHPTWLPGRYNNLDKPRLAFHNEGVWQLPVSVTPWLRLPVFWLAFKNLPLSVYKRMCSHILRHDGVLVIYFHPWEFIDISSYALPTYVKRIYGDALLDKLWRLLNYLQQDAQFETHISHINSLNAQEL